VPHLLAMATKGTSTRPYVSLQSISFSIDEPPECCTICLEDLVDQCEAQPCQHKFDFLCLVTWLQERAACPLCNRNVHEVRYGLNENEKQRKVYKVPQRSEDSGDSARRRLPYQDNPIQRRRFVYRHNLYSLHVGSNERQPPGSTYREICPQSFLKNPELISRATMWLRRELRVFQFLNTARNLPFDREPIHGPRPSNIESLLDYIIEILKTVDIQDSTRHAENMIQESLGRSFTRLFLHELKAWLRSPYESLSAWDFHVQYKGRNTLLGVSQNRVGAMVECPDIVLKYSEPAEARKPPSTQAWRLYVFKGDNIVEVIELWERSVWLLGREDRVVDVVTRHPSCSGQHAALQFQYTASKDGEKEQEEVLDRGDKHCVTLYLIDLDSANGTSLNGERIESSRYVEVKHKDVIKFGGSDREYVLLLPYD